MTSSLNGLTDYDVKLLKDLNGDIQEDLHWGAAMSVSASFLASKGYTTGFPSVQITDKGKEYLASISG